MHPRREHLVQRYIEIAGRITALYVWTVSVNDHAGAKDVVSRVLRLYAVTWIADENAELRWAFSGYLRSRYRHRRLFLRAAGQGIFLHIEA